MVIFFKIALISQAHTKKDSLLIILTVFISIQHFNIRLKDVCLQTKTQDSSLMNFLNVDIRIFDAPPPAAKLLHLIK